MTNEQKSTLSDWQFALAELRDEPEEPLPDEVEKAVTAFNFCISRIKDGCLWSTGSLDKPHITTKNLKDVMAHIAELEAENKRLREGLEELVRLGGSNGEYGNSIGNQIAKASLAQTGEKSCKKCGGDGYDHGICEGLRLPMSEAELEREAFQLAVDIWECGAERDRKNDTDKCKQWIVELTKKYRGK